MKSFSTAPFPGGPAAVFAIACTTTRVLPPMSAMAGAPDGGTSLPVEKRIQALRAPVLPSNAMRSWAWADTPSWVPSPSRSAMVTPPWAPPLAGLAQLLVAQATQRDAPDRARRYTHEP